MVTTFRTPVRFQYRVDAPLVVLAGVIADQKFADWLALSRLTVIDGAANVPDVEPIISLYATLSAAVTDT